MISCVFANEKIVFVYNYKKLYFEKESKSIGIMEIIIGYIGL